MGGLSPTIVAAVGGGVGGNIGGVGGGGGGGVNGASSSNSCCDMSLRCWCRWRCRDHQHQHLRLLFSSAFVFFFGCFVLYGSVATLYAWLAFTPGVHGLPQSESSSSLGCLQDNEGSWSVGVFYGDSPFSLKPIEKVHLSLPIFFSFFFFLKKKKFSLVDFEKWVFVVFENHV